MYEARIIETERGKTTKHPWVMFTEAQHFLDQIDKSGFRKMEAKHKHTFILEERK